ncbi:hypothetical protein GOP47_0018082 [Adiantum capillus-veneris]|uniref:Uncharacterized protein n=1 Tax=Adiantum capillus-veneris TaxID=13818 RepID=A0A9D4ZAA8_ADICA|nr:hypothetical protein GOP47_0018082 [Adiantum capillus-veneris]
MAGMHRVGSANNVANSTRPRKERRLTYVLCDSQGPKHCSGINCLTAKSLPASDGGNIVSVFSGSRDGTVKRWESRDKATICTGTFESHVDWVNDVVLSGETLVSCSSDTTIKTWGAYSDDVHCLKTFHQHSDYVISLAAAKHSNLVASAGLGGEVFVWDLDAANLPLSKATVEGNGCETNGVPQGYTPITAKGHKESVYALAMNDTATILVSGGTEKAVRVWDPRSGAKTMKLKGHTDNIRALLLDPTGRFCLSGSSDSMIRLWDLGQQRCVHSYAVHTDSVWALATTTSFTHVYSGGRDLAVYLTDLSSRESLLVCSEEHPILSLALEGDEWLWVATSDSSFNKWPTKERSSAKNLSRASSFVAGTLPFARARACLENSPPTPLNTTPTCTVPGTPAIVRHTVLNDKRHVLTKDAAGIVKLWEITKGAVIDDFGEVSFEDKEKELFEMVSIPSWFTIDTRLGSISVHLETPQCFSAEMYAVDLQVPGASEEQKLNLGQETLRGLFSHCLIHRRQKPGALPIANGDLQSSREVGNGNHTNGKASANLVSQATLESGNPIVYPAFDFSAGSSPSIISEGSQGGPWRKKLWLLVETDDEKNLPSWCLDCLLHGRLPPRENTKCSFYLHPYEGSIAPVITQGKLSAPRILRINKVINYVLERLVLERTPEETSASQSSSQHHTVNGVSSRSSMRTWQLGTRPEVEILCNQQLLRPEMSLATVRQYIWKKPDDLYLYYRVTSSK